MPAQATNPGDELKRSPSAAPIRSCSRWGLPCRFRYRSRGALLPHPFTLAVPEGFGGLLSVALSLGSPPPGVTRHRRFAEPGLSSRCRSTPRPPGPLAGGRLPVSLGFWQQQREQNAAALAVDRAVDQLRAVAPLEGDDRGELVGHV